MSWRMYSLHIASRDPPVAAKTLYLILQIRIQIQTQTQTHIQMEIQMLRKLPASWWQLRHYLSSIFRPELALSSPRSTRCASSFAIDQKHTCMNHLWNAAGSCKLLQQTNNTILLSWTTPSVSRNHSLKRRRARTLSDRVFDNIVRARLRLHIQTFKLYLRQNVKLCLQ